MMRAKALGLHLKTLKKQGSIHWYQRMRSSLEPLKRCRGPQEDQGHVWSVKWPPGASRLASSVSASSLGMLGGRVPSFKWEGTYMSTSEVLAERHNDNLILFHHLLQNKWSKIIKTVLTVFHTCARLSWVVFMVLDRLLRTVTPLPRCSLH